MNSRAVPVGPAFRAAGAGWLFVALAPGLVIVFAAFWTYFATPVHQYLRSDRQAFGWGYGHYVIFGSAAAIGAGIEVATEQVTRESHISAAAAGVAVNIALAARDPEQPMTVRGDERTIEE